MRTLPCSIAIARRCVAACRLGALVLVLGSAPSAHAESDRLYQVSTIDALLAGVYDGVAEIGAVLEHGGFGLGTFAGLDGELIALDGVVYRAASDGRIDPVPDETETPFIAVTDFAPDQQFALPALDLAGFRRRLEQRFPSANLIYAIKAEGEFQRIRYRSIARQHEPYRPLAEVARDQRVFEQDAIAGTLVGFWCPAFTQGLNVPGLHLHFLSADRRHGGHVLGFASTGLEVEIDHTAGWEIAFPSSPAYLDADLGRDRSAELNAVEQSKARKPDADAADTEPAPAPHQSRTTESDRPRLARAFATSSAGTLSDGSEVETSMAIRSPTARARSATSP